MRSFVHSARATAFLARSVRQESRLISHHVMRGGLAALILAMVFLQLTTSSLFGAAGSRLAHSIVEASYWFLTLVGLLYFSVAITEEKEEETLPLLRMTGVSNFALLIGKSVPRLAIVILFLLVATPFLILSITMGGVVTVQLWLCVMGLICYALLLSQVGLLASTVCYTSRGAFSLSTTLWLLFELGYLVLLLIGYGWTEYGWPAFGEWFTEASSWLRERTLMNTLGGYLLADRGDPMWGPQMTFHLLAAVACFLLSWSLFEPCNSKAIGQGIAAQEPFQWRQLFRRAKATSRTAPRRAIDPAMAWKSWRFLVGGWSWFFGRLFGLPMGCIVLTTVVAIMIDEAPEPEAFAGVLMTVGVAAFLVELARSLGRVLNDEVYQQTVSSLCMIPKSTDSIVWMLVAGSLPIVIPSVCCFGLGFFLMLISEPFFARDFLEPLAEPWFWHCFSWVALTVHLGLLLSTWVRYGGMVFATGLMIVATILTGMTMGAFAFLLGLNGSAAENLFRYLLPLGLITLECFLCIVCQRMVIARVNSVVGR